MFLVQCCGMVNWIQNSDIEYLFFFNKVEQVILTPKKLLSYVACELL